MLRIVSMDVLDGDTLDIELSNGHIILSETDVLFRDPVFAAFFHTQPLYRPKTDGGSLYCADGPRYSLDELMALLRQGD